MIEFALEKYPIRHVLTNGIQSMIRPLCGDDAHGFTLSIESFAKCGFVELVRLPDYLRDMQAQPHDYVLMGLKLSVDFENTGGGD